MTDASLLAIDFAGKHTFHCFRTFGQPIGPIKLELMLHNCLAYFPGRCCIYFPNQTR